MTYLAMRFWSHVDFDGPLPADRRLGRCWVWTGSRSNRGYGQVRAEGRLWLAHRFAWLLAGRTLSDQQILHRCDNPPCVKPRHLFEGTQSDNMRDCSDKGRLRVPGLRGRAVGGSKLTEAAVHVIRSAPRTRGSGVALANRFGVSRSLVSQVRGGHVWGWLDIPELVIPHG